MQGWPQDERADIVIGYGNGDTDSRAAATLIGLLLQGGYLGTEWANRIRPPRCYIEVKATMEPCGTPFFMSDARYRKVSFTPTQAYSQSR